MNIQQYLSDRKRVIDTALERYLDEVCECPPRLKEAMRYSLMAGGKRIRPILAIAAAEACGAEISNFEFRISDFSIRNPQSAIRNAEGEPISNRVLPIALALEMIHTFSLIHDDLPAMDDDDLRRGMPTCHKVYGDAMAILAGDGLLAEAFYCLASLGGHGGPPLRRGGALPPPILTDIIRDIAEATGPRGMVGGQVMDLIAEGRLISRDELEKLHRAKTGALLKASVTSGAKAVEASEAHLAALAKYGECLGLAFQIADDILDLLGKEEEIGKPVGSDIENKKSTYPSILGIEESKRLASALIEEAISALKEFDSKAEPLREIAGYIVERKS